MKLLRLKDLSLIEELSKRNIVVCSYEDLEGNIYTGIDPSYKEDITDLEEYFEEIEFTTPEEFLEEIRKKKSLLDKEPKM